LSIFSTHFAERFCDIHNKFELMLTRRAKAYNSSGSAENWGVHAKLIYKYQILYLDRITIVRGATLWMI